EITQLILGQALKLQLVLAVFAEGLKGPGQTPGAVLMMKARNGNVERAPGHFFSGRRDLLERNRDDTDGKSGDQERQGNLEQQSRALRQDLFMPIMHEQMLKNLLNHELKHRNQNQNGKEYLDFLADIGGFFNPVQHESLFDLGSHAMFREWRECL
ncbi:hypothetical protein, partial [Gluconobacter oxydans]|uniref:hypothetical protein n=1 Tax=Gluconobacter oxydans TaxID=442 RepID=UPI001E51A53D